MNAEKPIVVVAAAVVVRRVVACRALLWVVALAAAGGVGGGCAAPLKPGAFAGTGPAFDPVAFWTGTSASWGVIENGGGEPTGIITTRTEGTGDGAGGLRMTQRVETKGKPSPPREWHIRRVGEGRYEATASDMVGVAHGAPVGRTLHWRWTLAAKPGHPLLNVTMDQWMYLAADGRTLLVRTVVRKLGLRLAEISETFMREG